jgi:hypothetical protein
MVWAGQVGAGSVPGSPHKRTRRGVRRALALAAAALGCGAINACETQEREVSFRTPLSNIPGAFRGSDDPRDQGPQHPGGVLTGASADAEVEKLFELDERGRERLLLGGPRMAMNNLRRLLRMEDQEQAKALMVEQLLSVRAFEHVTREGKEPRDAAEFFFFNRQDVLATLARMPFGEQSPDVAFERFDGRLYQLRLRRAPARGLRFDSLWLALEGGKWKVVWLSEGAG